MFRRLAVSAFITSTLGTRTICVMGAKSVAALNGILLYSHGFTALVAVAAMPIVRPSAGALATMSAPMLPPAPGLLSMMTGPSVSFTRSARMRAVLSIGPPAAYGTTRRMGRCCWATAWLVPIRAVALASRVRRKCLVFIVLVVGVSGKKSGKGL